MSIKAISATFISITFLIFAEAHADLLIAPTRVVFERGERSTELIVVNRGDEQFAFRISIENRRMLLDGSLEDAEIAQVNELHASDIIRFSPRRLVLEPNERQTIRISANTNGLESGEYRSHLRLMSAPMSAGRTLARAADSEQDGISIELIAVRSITIPVIVRIGNLDADVSIESASLQENENTTEALLVARMNREGNRSVYGDIQVYLGDSLDPVYYARGIAIYTPNTERDVILPIPLDIADNLRGENVRIAFVSSDPSRPGIIAEFSTLLQ